MLTYKGYNAKLEVDVEADVLHGIVLDINDTLTFEAKTVDAAKLEFRKTVDAYLEFCQQLGKEPDKPFSGKFLFRTTPDIHRTIYLAATQEGKSINAWTEGVLSEAAQRTVNARTSVSGATSGRRRKPPSEDPEYARRLVQVEERLNQLQEASASVRSRRERKSPFEEYEYEQRLAQLEKQINALQEAVKPYLRNDSPDVFPNFLAAIEDFLKDKELKELIEEIGSTELAETIETPSLASVKATLGN
jgi:predicted HicB family RNase H-like nuclease